MMETGVSPGRKAAAALALALAVWVLNTWPLAGYFGEGIPYSHYRNEERAARYMVPGDHLQLLYHFSLGADMVFGETELFVNPYEFNFDGDDTRREPGGYFFPFSILFGFRDALSGQAGAWNLTVIASLWLTVLFSWMLAGRFTSSLPACLLAAVVSIAVPMRWTSLMGGSPTGFAMAWLPLLWLAVTDIVRRGSVKAGAAAGLAVLLLCLGDTHSFFFGVLSMPLAALLVLLHGKEPGSPGPSGARMLAAALPAAVGIALAYAYTRWTTLAPAGSAAEGGRSWREVGFFAPDASGLFGGGGHGADTHIYLGYVLLTALAAGGFVALRRGGRDRRRQALWVMILLSFLGIVFLALGPNGPAGGLALKAARKIVPPYGMVRQSAKIFCLVPTLAVFGVALGWGALARKVPPRRMWLLAVTAAAALLVEYRLLYRPGISLLAEDQGAYAAVATDAASKSELPRGVAIPLWPGDSHLSSIYEHYAFRYRIRLVNGYRPFVPAGYKERVFLPFESLNQGDISGEQAAELTARGIRYLFLHEDIFPEKVSPFPVGIVLDKLLADSRLRFLGRDGPVWAFELTGSGDSAGRLPGGPFFPAWHRNGASAHRFGDASVEREESGRPFLRLTGASSCSFGTFPVGSYPRRHWLVRARGDGRVGWNVRKMSAEHSAAPAAVEHQVRSMDWKWFALPFPAEKPFLRTELALELLAGTVDIDRVYLGAGSPAPAPVKEMTFWPAARFFRPGYTAGPGGAVIFRAGHDPADTIFYGPLFPLDRGRYDVTLLFDSPAARDTVLGRFSVRGEEHAAATVTVGEPARIGITTEADRPLRLDFTFSGNADIEIQGVRLDPAR